MTERQLQDAILELCAWSGWRSYHVFDSRRSTPGFPDLILVSASRQKTIAIELKSAKGRITDAQQEWLDDLAATGITTAVWRPTDWTNGTIEEALR